MGLVTADSMVLFANKVPALTKDDFSMNFLRLIESMDKICN
jgi:hypothetical protein